MSNTEKRVTLATRCDYVKRAFYLATFEHHDDKLVLVEEDEFTHDKFKDMSYDDFMLEYEVFASLNKVRH